MGLRTNKLILSLILLSTLKPIAAQLRDRTPDYDSKILADAIVNAINSLVDSFGSTLSITTSSQVEPYMDEQTAQVLDRLLIELSKTIEYQITLSNKKTKFQAAKLNLILIDDFESLEDLYYGLDERAFYFSGHYIIGLTEPEKWTGEKIGWIMEKFWSLYITNLAVMVINLDNPDEILSFTYFPFGELGCEVPVTHMINVYKSSIGNFSYPKHHFPDKFKNLHQCPLKVAAVRSMPFLGIRKRTLIGFEGLLVQELSRIMNFHIRAISLNKDLSQGEILSNGTATGVIAFVQNRTANFCVGFFDLSNRKVQAMDATVMYHSEKLYFIAPPKRPLLGIDFLLSHFHRNLWWTIVLFTIGLGFIHLYLKTGTVFNLFDEPHFSLTVLNISGILTGQTLELRRLSEKRRLIIVSFCLLVLVLRSTYQSSYFLYTQTPMEHETDTNKMIKRNFTFYSYQHFKSFLDAVPQLKKRVIYNNSRSFLLKKEDQIVRTLGIKETRLTSMSHINYKNFYVANHGHVRVATKNPLTSVGVSIFLKKYSCLTNTFNDHILRLSQAGVIDWFRKRYENEDIKNYIRDEYRKHYRLIRVGELSGAFLVLIFGLVLSMITFFYEYFTVE